MCVALFLFMWVVLSCVITKLSIGAVKKQQSTSIIMLGVILQIWITKNWVITFVIIENSEVLPKKN